MLAELPLESRSCIARSDCDARYPSFTPMLIGMLLIAVVVLFFIAMAVIGGAAAS